MACQHCRTRHSLELSAKEFKALSASWKLTEKCPTCLELTEWAFAEPEVPAQEQIDFWDWLATTGEYFEPSPSTPLDERRQELRVEVSTPLEIVGAAGEAEEVVSKNISRNGLCFSSRRKYQPGERVQVMLQPREAGDPVTKRGLIVRAATDPDGATLYGVRLESDEGSDPSRQDSQTRSRQTPAAHRGKRRK